MQCNDIPTSFFFWGRNHVHGTHVVEAFLEAISEWGGETVDNLAATFFSTIDKQGHFVFFQSKEDLLASRDSLCAEVRGTVDGELVFVGLRCDGEAVTDVIPDDEPTLVADVSICEVDKVVSQPFPGRDRIFTRLVAMNKFLLKEILSVDGYTPWRLGRFAMKIGNTDWQPNNISVKLLNNVGGLMTRSRIFFDEEAVGEIQFARRRA